MVTVNCGAIPANLVESRTVRAREGRVHRRVRAQDRPLPAKPTAARCSSTRSARCRSTRRSSCCACCRSGEIQPIGARHPREVDVRVIAATNKRLLDEVEAGRFREDLYYRLNVVQVTIPPLARTRRRHPRARPPPARARSRSSRGCAPLGITDDALALLVGYDWPGNVRQLQNALFRAAVLCDGDGADPRRFPADRRARRTAPHRRRAADGDRRAASPCSAPTAICARWRRSRPTSSASRSAIIAAA